MNKCLAMLLPDKEVPARKKRGRQQGSGIRTAQLNIRVQPELMQLIEHLQRAEQFKGFSISDIIHHCISGDTAYMVATGSIQWSAEIDNLINKIKT